MNFAFTPLDIYTSEDLKWDAPGERHFKSLLISDHEELKCPILILRWFKLPIYLSHSAFCGIIDT